MMKNGIQRSAFNTTTASIIRVTYLAVSELWLADHSDLFLAPPGISRDHNLSQTIGHRPIRLLNSMLYPIQTLWE